ncbi:MAG: GntR family transcriptional regulator [Acidimicrobiales bacterium]
MTTWMWLSRVVVAVEPTYLSLADELARVAAEARPGERLPSEHDLVAIRAVSRLTARAALQELERRHLVRRVRGSGTFVARRIEYRVSPDMPPSWSETVRRAGGTPETRVLRAGTQRATGQAAAALGLGRGARVTAIRRVGIVDGVVANVAASWVPQELAPVLADHVTAGGSIYAALRAQGLAPRRRWLRAGLEVVPSVEAGLLEFEGRPLVWLLEGLNEDAATGRPIELSSSWMRPDVYRVVLELGPAQ